MILKKKIIPILLLLTMLIGLIPTAYAATSLCVADLTTLSTIHNIGLPASGIYTMSGSYSMQWSGADLNRNIVIPVKVKDFSGEKYLEFWVYSKTKNNSEFTLALISDSQDTACTDYYYTSVKVNWSGWRVVSLKCDDETFVKVHSPIGFDEIDEIRLWPTYGDKKIEPDTELYFDMMTITDTQTVAADVDAASSDLIIADYSDPVLVAETGMQSSTEVEGSGEVTLKWAGDNLQKTLAITDEVADWSEYKCLVMDVYSKKDTFSEVKVVIMSNNPDTSGNDYYMGSMPIDWIGWKKIVFKLSDSGTLKKTRTPIGFSQVDALQLWPTYNNTMLDPETVLYFDKVYLSSEEVKQSMNNDVDYMIPSEPVADGTDAAAMVKEKHPNNGHPRLLFDSNDLENMKSLIKTDPFMKKTYSNVITTANAALDEAVLTYGTPDGKRLPRTAPNMMPPLAMAYLMTGNVKYKDRLWIEIEAVCNFPDWNPSHFLDVGDFARGVAYAYDWLYDEWTPEQKRVMRNAFVRNAFAPSMPHLRSKTSFASQTNNWNQVVCSGIGLAALAMCDEPGYEAITNEVLNRTAECLPTALVTLDPDGACIEGTDYWSYANENFFIYDNSLFTSMDYDFGLSDFEGLSKTGLYPIAMMGPTTKTFNFADSAGSMVQRGIFFYLARRYNNPALGGYELSVRQNGGDWIDLAVYRPDENYSDFSKFMPLDNRFRGEQELATFRSSWNDDNALFVGFKGGSNQASHCDLDLGTFVLDALGERWACELGKEYYEAPGMWEFGEDGGRWKYYKKNPEGQNTLIINPGDKPLQNVYASAEFEKYELSDAASYSVIDLSEAYKDYASEVKRGIGIINNRSSVIIQDEIKTTKPSEIYSAFHTEADVEILADKKSAVLSIGDKRLMVELISDAGEFIVMDPVPLKTSALPPDGGVNQTITGIKKLAVHMTDAVNPTISILFTPVVTDEIVETNMDVVPLSDWESYKTSSVALTEMYVDGVALDGFSPYNTLYTIDTGIVGTVDASANADTEISIIQADGLNSTASVIARSKTTGMQTVYNLTFEEKLPAMFTENVQSYEIKGVQASSVPEELNVPENTFDGNSVTKWAANGEGEWIIWDLGEVVPINSVAVAFMSGDKRQAKLAIEVSQDGKSYKQVFNGLSSGKTNNLENFAFAEENARYVKLISNGNTSNKWISLTEVSIPKIFKGFDDTQTHWAKEDINLFAAIDLVNGVSETEFAPDAKVTRAEFVAMIVRALGLNGTEDYQLSLSDVETGKWYAKDIAVAAENGLLPAKMCEGDVFTPNAPITREEMAAIIICAYESEKTVLLSDVSVEKFADAGEIAPEYAEYVAKGLSLRFMVGISSTEFAPKANATRAEAVVMIKRLLTQVRE